ncbi:unnamed protein product [Orchesella dallaii]|uniref:Uncharacterized protein n=1 Tax=Orchesella dallaii TaxID=48710 RepID=A0ABP1RTV2_9HEXA
MLADGIQKVAVDGDQILYTTVEIVLRPPVASCYRVIRIYQPCSNTWVTGNADTNASNFSWPKFGRSEPYVCWRAENETFYIHKLDFGVDSGRVCAGWKAQRSELKQATIHNCIDSSRECAITSCIKVILLVFMYSYLTCCIIEVASVMAFDCNFDF